MFACSHGKINDIVFTFMPPTDKLFKVFISSMVKYVIRILTLQSFEVVLSFLHKKLL